MYKNIFCKSNIKIFVVAVGRNLILKVAIVGNVYVNIHYEDSGTDLLLLLVLLAVLGEGVEEVVDDLGGEDADVEAVGHFLCVALHLHVERQEARISE